MPVDLVVPVKELDRAKSRLAAVSAALGPSRAGRAHSALALALVRDTLRAATCADVRRVAVVTVESAARLGLEDLAHPGTEVVPDAGGGLDAAVRQGVEHLRRTGDGSPAVVVALQSDLPALRPAELDEALDRAREVLTGAPAAFVADHTGTGTTLLAVAPDAPPDPHFGPGSAAAHRAAGAVPLLGPWPGLRWDVDTPADLEQVRALGTGPAVRTWPRAGATLTAGAGDR